MSAKASTPTPDETPKQSIAKRVVTPKRKYFFPELGRVYEASSLADAQKLASQQVTEDQKEGDA